LTDLLDDIVPAAPSLDLDALERDWSEGNFDDPMDAVRNAQRNIPLLIAEVRSLRGDQVQLLQKWGLEYRNNGSTGYAKAFKHVCSGCGREFDSNRRQLPGKRVWCGRAECRKEASALRARDYRDRKAKEPA
jgi:hypothetical protein